MKQGRFAEVQLQIIGFLKQAAPRVPIGKRGWKEEK